MLRLFQTHASRAARLARFVPSLVDAHCHLLPGVDDGPPDEAAALDLLRALSRAGFRGVVCTPHVMAACPLNSAERLRRVFSSFLPAAGRTAPLSLSLSAEYMLDELFPSLLASPAGLLPWPAPPVLPGSPEPESGSPLLLVELPQSFLPPGWLDTLDAIRAAGFSPVLAHPERYHRLLDRGDFLSLRRGGLLFQGDLGSLAGFYGPAPRLLALALREAGLYSWWASDSHSPSLPAALRRLS